MVSIDRAHLIDDVLSRLPAHERRSVMGEAIRNAGTLNLPPDDDGFLSFVRGPFAQAAQSVLDGTRAAELVEAIVAKLVVGDDHVEGVPVGERRDARRPIRDVNVVTAGGEQLDDRLPKAAVRVHDH
ncbi:MAG: hypothetical protein RIF41_31510, partial [Polyangiaceae bacterium]